LQLGELLGDGEDMTVAGTRDIGRLEIAGLTCDSRAVVPGALFAALPGSAVDGREFIAQALDKGAGAVLAPTGTELPNAYADVPLITADNPRRCFAQMAARFFQAQPATTVAVTGTNGKTSVVSFVRRIWTLLGHKAAALGTLGIDAPGFEAPGDASASGLTTPDPVILHRDLSALAGAGFDHAAMEASSHGLAQYRLDGVRVRAAAFTNLTRDHLDYHGDMDAYLAAKLRLFTELLDTDGIAVVNADSDFAGAVIDACTRRGIEVRTYGEAGHDVRIAAVEAKPDGQRVVFEADGRAFEVHLPLVGRFQVSNVACALALVHACGADMARAAATLPGLEGAPGRLQFIGCHRSGASVFVDYAHTPDALANVLASLRPHTHGWLHVVFGCGGDRDKGKRPQMGRIACDMADAVVVTDDNPRGEDPAAIRAEIMEGCAARDALIEIADREQAIQTAIKTLEPGDVLVVAGKGHERGQIVGDTVLPFDDAEQCRKALGLADAPGGAE
jgi:UDP-N-acetylmuramoyl-L-alanyl-D-glutamate--2,6-diaminopimelate ligase